MHNQGRLLDPATQDWGKLFSFGPWECYRASGPNKAHWCELVVRLRDATASKRSWWLYWSTSEQRFSRNAYARDLERRHPDLPVQLKVRLRDWHPER
jgi:hypothetical protein